MQHAAQGLPLAFLNELAFRREHTMTHHFYAAALPIAVGLTLAAVIPLDARKQAGPKPTQDVRLTVPNRPATSVFKGASGERWSSDVSFDRRSRSVTVTLSVRDANGYFIPNLRRENFAVYEDGRRQTNVTVEIEHAPITLALLLEGGGRYQQLNREIAAEIRWVVRPLLGSLGSRDKVAVFSYADTLATLMDFDRPLADLEPTLNRLDTPGFSEANVYDALIAVLDRMKGVEGRKAILLASSGIDTFSLASFEDVLGAAERSHTPVYTIDLSGAVTQLADSGPLARLNWARAREQLRTLARSSGGRAYERASVGDAVTIYDDVMEHLRIRYVITYVPDGPGTEGARHAVRVELVNRNGAPLRIVDPAGRSVAARVIAQSSYES
jgi:VWFA-related protein